MNSKQSLWLVVALSLLAAVFRIWDLSTLPAGFTHDEIAYLRMTETLRQGEVAVYYQVGDGHGRALGFSLLNIPVTNLLGGGFLGYRLVPVAASSLTLALLYALARRLFGRPVALIAVGAMAINFRVLLLARTSAAESIVPLMVVFTLWLMVGAFNVRREIIFRAPDTFPFALLAVALGAVGYVHYTALALGPLMILFLAHLLITHQPLSRRIWSTTLFVIALATITGLPYLLSTVRHFDLSEPYIFWSQRPQSLGALVDGALHAIGGLIWRGDPDPARNLPEQPLIGPLMAVLMLIGVVASLRHWREPRYALVLLMLGAGLLTDTWIAVETTFEAQLVALPAVFMLVGIGAERVVFALRGRGVRDAWQPVAALLVIGLLVNVVLVRGRLFERWREDAAVRAAHYADYGQVALYLDATRGSDLPVAICVADMNEPIASGLTPRQLLSLMTFGDDTAIRWSDCQSGLVFINAGAPMRLVFIDPRHRDLMPPELQDWLVGAAPIQVEELPPGSVLRLDVEQRIRDMGGFWDTRAPTYYMPGEDGLRVRVDLPAPLEQNLTFAGYDPRLYAASLVPGGDPLVVVTYWRVDGPLPPRLGIFAHLLAHPTPLVAPVAESNTLAVASSALRNRDMFVQVSYVWPGEQVMPGDHVLTVGAYSGSAAILDQHLEVLDRANNMQPRGDRLLLGTIHVAEPGGD